MLTVLCVHKIIEWNGLRLPPTSSKALLRSIDSFLSFESKPWQWANHFHNTRAHAPDFVVQLTTTVRIKVLHRRSCDHALSIDTVRTHTIIIIRTIRVLYFVSFQLKKFSKHFCYRYCKSKELNDY